MCSFNGNAAGGLLKNYLRCRYGVKSKFKIPDKAGQALLIYDL